MLKTLNRHISWALAALFVTLTLASATQGQQRAPMMGKKATQRLMQDWHDRIKKAETLLEDGESKKALRQTKQLAKEMAARLHSGEAIQQYLGSVYVLRAVALADLGKEREAIWQWHVASQIFPRLQGYDLAKFGEPGQFLIDHAFEPSTVDSDDKEALQASLKAMLEGPDQSGLTPPRKIKAPQPDFPAGRYGTGKVSVIVASVIDTEGRPTSPRIIARDGEFTMVSATLDALMDWRFKPATHDGEPVPFHYVLTVNFSSEPAL